MNRVAELEAKGMLEAASKVNMSYDLERHTYQFSASSAPAPTAEL